MTRSPRLSPPLHDVREGVLQGTFLAAFFTVIAGVVLILTAGSTVPGGKARAWAMITAFYFGAGTLGGALFGALRPVRAHYWGRYLTAYLLLVLVYGGGTIALWPLFANRSTGPSKWTMLAAWAVCALAIAPLYVRFAKSW